MKKNTVYTLGSLIILLICAFCFVVLPAFEGKSSGRQENAPVFGKYNGKTIGEIYESGDVKYLEWLFDKGKDENIKKAVSILTGLVEMTPEETKKEINAMPIQETQKQRIKDKYSTDEIKNILIKLNKSKLGDLTYKEAEDILKGE